MSTYDENGYEKENAQPEPQAPNSDFEARREASRQEWQEYSAPRKASPYADSPYMNQGEQHYENHGYAPQPPKKKAPRKGGGVWGRRVIASVLCLCLVAAGCGITAWSVNSHWEKRFEVLSSQLDQKVKSAQQKNNSAVSGSPVAANNAMTPAQVYAQNVHSVVSIVSTTKPNQFGQVGQGSGSGFILSQDGYVVTNYHVVEGAAQVKVVTDDGMEYPAQIVGQEPSNDVAVLKVEAQDLPAVTIGTSSDLAIGDMVVAIGNPLGSLAATQTVGYICGKDRDVSTGGATINMLQTDAAINPGNSGGPLFNMNGEVVGITTAKFSGTTNSGASIEGIGFAIPIDDVMSMVEDLVQFGYVTGAYLGVTIKDVEPEVASAYNLPLGAYVVSVVEDGSAYRAGLQEKDIIVGLGEYEVENRTDLTRALRHYKAGDTTTISFVRGGVTQVADITLDEKPRDLNQPQSPEDMPDMPSEGDYDEWFDFFHRFFG